MTRLGYHGRGQSAIPFVAARVFVETPRTAAVVATTGTDDRGEYRIGGLSAGTFAVAVVTIGPPVIQAD